MSDERYMIDDALDEQQTWREGYLAGKAAAETEIERLRAALLYIKSLPLGDELDIARRAAHRALEGE